MNSKVAAHISFRKIRAKLLIVILSTVPLSFAWGNGGGIYLTSSAFRSGNPICREIKDVDLMSEKLVINILPDGYCEVTVKYVLWNRSDKDYLDIDYGFPIDYLSSVDNDENLIIKNIHFSCNGETLNFSKSESALISRNGLEQLEPIGMGADGDNQRLFDEYEVFRIWYYTKFDVEKYSLVDLEVRYSYRSLQLDDQSPMPMDYPAQVVGQLLYDFSPASGWGDGIIRDFYMEVNFCDLPHPSSDGESYGVRESTGIDFQQKEPTKLIYRTRNFDLKKAKPFFISYCVSGVPTWEIMRRHLVSPKEYSIKTSHEQKGYPATNLCDMNIETTWVGGVGDWIECTFDSNDIIGFCIVNGYQKNAQTYEQNNRVKTLRIDPKTKGMEEEVATLRDQAYSPLYFENIIENSLWYEFDLSTAQGPIKTIRFTIDEVYPGTKYSDTCIPEILFFKDKRDETNGIGN